MFRFENVNPGDYRLCASGAGYLESFFGARGVNDWGTVIHLARKQTLSGQNINLTHESVITGRIVDENGDPVPGVEVNAISQFWMHGHKIYGYEAADVTNDTGAYRLAGISPGRLYIRATPQNDSFVEQPGETPVSLVALFYPDASVLPGATAVEVHAGDNLDGINFLLRPRPAFHIRGVIKPEDEPDALSRYRVAAALPASSGDLLDFEGEIEDDGVFDIPGLMPGAYDVQVRTDHGVVLAMTPAEVRTSDINTLSIRVPRHASVRGTLRSLDDGAAAPANSEVSLVPFDKGMESRIIGFVAKDGSFTINGVPPGKYRISVPRSQPGVYIKSVSSGATEVPGSASFDIAEGGSPSLTVNLAADAGHVSGTVQSPAESTTNDYRIILVSQSNPSEPDLRMGTTDRTGHFIVATVPPGKYHAFAVSDFNTEVWWNPDFLRQIDSTAVEVEVPPNGDVQIPLAPTPSENVRNALDRMAQ
jgi:hypothetical protein